MDTADGSGLRKGRTGRARALGRVSPFPATGKTLPGPISMTQTRASRSDEDEG